MTYEILIAGMQVAMWASLWYKLGKLEERMAAHMEIVRLRKTKGGG